MSVYQYVNSVKISEMACIQLANNALDPSDQKKLLDAGFFLVTLSDDHTRLFCRSAAQREWHVLESPRSGRQMPERVRAILENEKMIYLGKKPRGVI